jgi:hypothetical protein
MFAAGARIEKRPLTTDEKRKIEAQLHNAMFEEWQQKADKGLLTDSVRAYRKNTGQAGP